MLITWIATVRKCFDAAQFPLSIGLLAWVPLSVAMTGWIGGAIEQFSSFTPIMIFFLISATTIDTPARLNKLFFIIGTVSAVIALHGIEQSQLAVGWSGATLIQERITYVGFLNDPNDLAQLLLVSVPMVLSFLHRRGNFFLAIVGVAATSAMLYSVYLTNSRGAIVALAVMAMVFSIFRYGFKKSLFLSPILLAVIFVASPGRISEISADEASASGRIEAWYDGFQMLKSHPIFGVGKSQFIEHHERTAHNSFVLALAELGVIGYFFWFSLIAVSGRMLITLLGAHILQSENDSPSDIAEREEHRRLARVLLYSLTGFCVTAFFLSRSYTITLYLLVAMIVGLYQSARSRCWPSLPAMTLKELSGWLIKLVLASIFALWLTTRILLAFN